MSNGAVGAALDAVLEKLKTAHWKERDALKEELRVIASGAPDRSAVREHLENAKAGLELEVRWEIDEIIEELTPPPPPPKEEPAEEPKPEDPNRPLSAADLQLVYDDPRGFALHKHKRAERWFATQRDPRTGQPQTFELLPEEVASLKGQLQGSPYWVIGSGVAGM